MGEKAFEGLKYVEFAWVAVGPLSGKYFADHGATVIRIESHARPETLRVITPFADGKPGIDRSMYFGRINANKYGASLDLNNPKGRELAWKLIMWADVVSESFLPGTMAKWGLDYESVSKVRPDIIYLSTCQQGQWGPYARHPGYGPLSTSSAGFSEASGWPDRMPTPPWGAYTDIVSPRFNSVMIMAALDYRRRTGKGQWIDQSQLESSLHLMAPTIMDYLVNRRILKRNGNRLAYAAPHGVFPCQGDDRWVTISVFTDEEWHAFCAAVSKPEWIKEQKFATLRSRKENEDELEKLVSDWTLSHTAEHVEELMQAASVPSSIVEKNSDLYEDSQLKHRNHFIRLKHPEMGYQHFEPQAAYILSKTPREIERPSPCLGEHNEYVYKELLGLTDDEIADCIVEGAITVSPGQEIQVTL